GWSYDLLTEEDKRLFCCLSVFTSGWTLDAAQAVSGIPSSEATLDRLISLTTKSLIRLVAGADSQPRYRMLETVREYGLEQSELSGEVDAARRAHSAYFRQLAH